MDFLVVWHKSSTINCTAFDETTQLNVWGMHTCFSVKLYLQKQRVGHIYPKGLASVQEYTNIGEGKGIYTSMLETSYNID